ncbi:MAG TPA: citrate (Si)-synthase [bacterium]|mgnify:CR=1 FL=1|nr:citrate (Si)-synthase [bacterium]
MATLQDKLSEQLPRKREEIRSLVKDHGDKVMSEVTVAQAFGGMRGVKGLICDTSLVEPDVGLIIRGRNILELVDHLPEEIFYLLLTGELPDKAALEALQADLHKRQQVPKYVWDVLDAMPEDSHPMTMFDTAILVMQKESQFAAQYRAGIAKGDLWKPALEDSLRLLAMLPGIAAGVYRKRFKKGPRIEPKDGLDWGGNYAHMLGVNDPTGEFANMIRLYLVLHSDHEGGNVSAHTCHCVASALSDPYYSVSAGLNGLAGPLHGLANQECLRFVLSLIEQYKGVPSKEQLTKFAWDNLNSGKVIPGYGHAVLRVTDPRFTAFYNFGKRVCPEDDVFKTVALIFTTIPDILKEHGKAKNPWPNVDAGSGALLYHFGVTEFDYYTVMFGVSRAMGMLSQLIISRGLGEAIERPKSVGTDWVQKFVKG